VNWRFPELREALLSPAKHATTREDLLFSMDMWAFTTVDRAHPDAGPADPALQNLHYATARYFLQWLDRQEKLWPFYRVGRWFFAMCDVDSG